MTRNGCPSRLAIAAAPLLALFAAPTGCDTISGDIGDFMDGLRPPTPIEAAVWAADFNNPGKQRRGVVLLVGAPFGGEESYLELYRALAQESRDPLVRAAAIRGLGRWGGPADAEIIADGLSNQSEQIRLESAISLQRIHAPAVEDVIWKRLADQTEVESVRVELAIALGQYQSDASLQALCLALDDRSLTLNLAAADSLRIMTGRDFGIDARTWLSWYEAAVRSQEDPFALGETFLYPTFRREVGFFESLAFWDPVTFEDPAAPRGLLKAGRRTYQDDAEDGKPERP